MTTWLKKSWAWLVAVIVFAVAVIVWLASRKQSPWAAEKILEIQGGTEERVEQIADKAAAKQLEITKAWKAKRKAIKESEQKKIAKARDEALRLNEAALKRKVLEDLDDPL